MTTLWKTWIREELVDHVDRFVYHDRYVPAASHRSKLIVSWNSSIDFVCVRAFPKPPAMLAAGFCVGKSTGLLAGICVHC